MSRGRARRFAAASLGAVAAFALTATAASGSEADSPDQPATFAAVTAENGSPSDLQAVLELDQAGPDSDAEPCFGAASFAHTAWALIPAAETGQRVSVEATPTEASTEMPDLALFVQPKGAATPALGAPSLCDGRELFAGFTDRGDLSAAVSAFLAPGRSALVQVGWRDGDSLSPVLLTLVRSSTDGDDRPAGDDRDDAPTVKVGADLSLALGGATLGVDDPATPACPAPATVWRRLKLRHRGVYEATASGDASTLTALQGTDGLDSALACADLADVASLETVFTARPAPLRLRIGLDEPKQADTAAARVLGPFSRKARGCVKSRRARVKISADALEDVGRRRSSFVLGIVRQPCRENGRQAARVGVAIVRCAKGGRRCPKARGGRRAGGLARWHSKLARPLRKGTYAVTATAYAASRGKQPRRLHSASRRLVVRRGAR